MNEVRFSNIFIEKRTFHFRKALPLQGFPILHFGTTVLKLQKCKSIISAP